MDDLRLHDSFCGALPANAPLDPAELHVWAVPLTGDPAPFGALLSSDERQRLQRFRFADHQRRYQIGHGALRRILAGYLACEPHDVGYRYGPRGKPYLDGRELFFNLSHSGKLALIAVASAEVGIDLEKVRHLESLSPIAERHFSPREYAALQALTGEDRELAFYRCWTRKEAYIKALGEGLSMALDSFDVSLCEEPRLVGCHDASEDPLAWGLVDVSPGPDFVAAAALRQRTPRVRCFRLAGA